MTAAYITQAEISHADTGFTARATWTGRTYHSICPAGAVNSGLRGTFYCGSCRQLSSEPFGDGKRMGFHHVRRERVERVLEVGVLGMASQVVAIRRPKPAAAVADDHDGATDGRPKSVARRDERIVGGRGRDPEQVQAERREGAGEFGDEHRRGVSAGAARSPPPRDARGAP